MRILSRMIEPAVTLTDYALAIESAVFVFALARPEVRDRTVRFWFVVFFASIAVASALGGTVHGFFRYEWSPGRPILWRASLLSILVTSLAAWNISAILELNEQGATLVRRLAIAQLVIFSLVILLVTSKFYVAIGAYLPSTLILLFALASTYRRRPEPGIRWGIAGLALTLVAAAVQQLRIGLHPVYFNHNALYHVIQGAALGMIFVAAKTISRAWPPFRRTHAKT